jgi:hypothetical protein
MILLPTTTTNKDADFSEVKNSKVRQKVRQKSITLLSYSDIKPLRLLQYFAKTGRKIEMCKTLRTLRTLRTFMPTFVKEVSAKCPQSNNKGSGVMVGGGALF